MTKDELCERAEIAVEPYGGGFILADYSGKRHDRRGRYPECAYRGQFNEWTVQPIGLIPFATEAEAVECGEASIRVEA